MGVKEQSLDVKEQNFANEYIINNGNAYRAAIAAGYKPETARNAYEWLLETLSNPSAKRHLPFKPYLKAYIDEQLQKIQSNKVASAQEVMEYLTSVVRGESKSEIVVIEGEGQGITSARNMQKAPDEKDRLKAAELLGKTYGIFTDKLNVGGGVALTIVNDLEDDDE